MPTIRITEIKRSELLRRPLKPSVTRDRDVPGLALHVTTKRGFWALSYQLRGVNPRTGRRFGGGTRHELADAQLVGVAEARGLALAAKAVVRAGGDPHRDHMASRASVEAARAVVPQTVAEALDVYDRAMATRRQPSEWTRSENVRYARKSIRLLKAEGLAIGVLDVRMVRILVETAPGSDAERRHVFGGLSRFLAWCRKQGLVEANACDALDRDERPKPGKARDHVPTIETLRAVWDAVESEQEHVRALVRFLLLVPLRRDEAAHLRWSEVDLDHGRIRIAASRMKNGEAHELPLSAPAREILRARKPTATDDLVFSSPAKANAYDAWSSFLTRLRRRIGERDTPKDRRFVLHDIRRSFVSLLAENFDVDALDQVLAHKRSGVAGVYNRSRREKARTEALAAWAHLLVPEPDSNVVPIHAARKVI